MPGKVCHKHPKQGERGHPISLCCCKPCLVLSVLAQGAERSRSPSKGDVSRFTAEVEPSRGRLIEDWITQMSAEGPIVMRDKEQQLQLALRRPRKKKSS